MTVLFTDLVGFTALAEDRDPEAVRELLSATSRPLRIVPLHGGTVEKFIGDAVMAVWGTPVAHEDDAERAVRARSSWSTRWSPSIPDLQARAGVLTGEAAVTLGAKNQGMVAGDLVNTAARLQGVAEPGTVLVGDATRQRRRARDRLRADRRPLAQGQDRPVPAWRALRVVADRGGQGRADALEPPFVGRDEELRSSRTCCTRSAASTRAARLHHRAGRHRQEPAGLGAREVRRWRRRGIWWHRGRSPSYGEGVTFWALGEMVRRRAQLTEDDDEATVRAAD